MKYDVAIVCEIKNKLRTIQKRCMMIPKKVPDDPKQEKKKIILIFSKIPKIMPDKWLYRLSGIFFLGLSGTFLGIVRFFLGDRQANFLGSNVYF